MIDIRKPMPTGNVDVDKAFQVVYLELIKINTELKRIDDSVIHKATSSEISAMTEKVTPVSGDFLVIEDSADSNSKKKIEIGNLP